MIVVASGAGALATLVRQEDPTLTERYGIVLTPFPGADAARVEALITQPIEQSLQELREIFEVESTSRAGISQISIAQRDDISAERVDEGWTLIRQQVERASSAFPQGVGRPTVIRQYIGATTLLASISWQGEGPAPMAIINRQAELLEERLQNLSGTDETEIFGSTPEEIRVSPRADQLAATGLNLEQAAQLIASADSKVPAGRLRGTEGQIGLEVEGEFDSVARIRAVPLTTSDGAQQIRVGDVADVSRGLQDPLTALALHNGERAVFVGAYLETGTRVDLWSASARAVIEEFQRASPAGIEVAIIFDQSQYTERRLGDLTVNFMQSALIVFAVLFLMMGWRAAIAVSIALPLTIALVLILFNIFAMPLHQMSVTGLVIALGLLIDNAIITVDSVQTRRREGLSPLEAIRSATRFLMWPLFASTLTTALAFMPIALLPSSAGEFVGMIAVSVIFAVSASWIVALTVTPTVTSWLASRNEDPATGFLHNGLRLPVLSEGYRIALSAMVRRPGTAFGLALILPVTGFMLTSQLPAQFFPPTERDLFQIELTLSEDSSIEQAKAMAQDATAFIKATEGVEEVNWVIGETGPRVYYNAFNNVNGLAGYAVGFVRTSSAATTRKVLPGLAKQLRERYPQAQFLALPYEQGPPVPAPVEIFITGSDITELNRLGEVVRTTLAQTPGVNFSRASIETGVPVIMLNADETATALTGRRLTDLAAELRAELEGIPAGSILEGVQELPVRVVANRNVNGNLNAVRSLPLTVSGGGFGAPLSALGTFEIEPETAAITRRNGERTNIIYGFLEPYTLPAGVVADFQRRLAENGFSLPAGYRLSLGGEAAESGDASGALAGTALPLLIAMAGCIALVFNSFRLSGLVLFVGVLSVGYAFIGVWLFGLTFGFMAIIGALGLLGLAVNGAIVVLSAIVDNPVAKAGDPDAIVETVMETSRHLSSTTLTTIGGFVPLILSGDSFWLPLATGIAGGVAGSVALAMFFVPAMYRLICAKPKPVTQDELYALAAN